ncbi:MAG: PRC-barrel domain-containing protein [Firmicutes bacterium]|nr:PRC-barrel domain-containing protein [Bacillota bacterium]
MLSGRQLKGLAVKSAQGREIGRITDLVFDKHSGRLCGFTVNDHGLISKNRYLPLEAVADISLQGVISEKKEFRFALPPHLATLSDLNWRGSLIHDRSGRDKGSVADVFIENGDLAGFEVSNGMIGDLFQRRGFLPLSQAKLSEGTIQEVSGVWK